MTRWFSKWKGSPASYAVGLEWTKIVPKLLEAVKAGMDSGVVKDWQNFVGSEEGYMVWEGSERQVYADIEKYRPYIDFEPISPVWSLVDAIEISKEVGKLG